MVLQVDLMAVHKIAAKPNSHTLQQQQQQQLIACHGVLHTLNSPQGS